MLFLPHFWGNDFPRKPYFAQLYQFPSINATPGKQPVASLSRATHLTTGCLFKDVHTAQFATFFFRQAEDYLQIIYMALCKNYCLRIPGLCARPTVTPKHLGADVEPHVPPHHPPPLVFKKLAPTARNILTRVWHLSNDLPENFIDGNVTKVY